MRVILLICLIAGCVAQRRAGRFSGFSGSSKFGKSRPNKFGNKLAEINTVCPQTAVRCGIPTELPEEPDFDALKAGFKCLKAIDVNAADVESSECAELLEKLQSRGGRGRLSTCRADKETFCTDIVPTTAPTEVPPTDLKSLMIAKSEGGSGCFETLVENIDSLTEDCRQAIEEKQQKREEKQQKREEKQQKREEKLAQLIEALSSDEVQEACGTECLLADDPMLCVKEAKKNGDVTDECRVALKGAFSGLRGRGRGRGGRNRGRQSFGGSQGSRSRQSNRGSRSSRNFGGRRG